MNGSDPSGMMCLDALDPFSSGFSQCWSSGYSTAVHHPSKVIPIATVIVVGVVCIATDGIGCVVVSSLSSAVQTWSDIAHHCSATTVGLDIGFGLLGAGLGKVCSLGSKALEDAGKGAQYAFRAHSQIPTLVQAGVGTC